MFFTQLVLIYYYYILFIIILYIDFKGLKETQYLVRLFILSYPISKNPPDFSDRLFLI